MKSVGQYEKLENRKIFELQKKQYALPTAMREGFLREKNGFCKTIFSLKRPLLELTHSFHRNANIKDNQSLQNFHKKLPNL
ncbi:MAG: hypothetical protein ACI9XO_002282 [Paraglaciecola sp.]